MLANIHKYSSTMEHMGYKDMFHIRGDGNDLNISQPFPAPLLWHHVSQDFPARDVNGLSEAVFKMAPHESANATFTCTNNMVKLRCGDEMIYILYMYIYIQYIII